MPDRGPSRSGRPERDARARDVVARIIIVSTVFIASMSHHAALASPPYPRLMTMLWDDPEPKDFATASKFDAVEFSWEDIAGIPGYADSVRAIKLRNPELKVIGTVACDVHCSNWLGREIVMSEWTDQMELHDATWWLRDVDGDYFKVADAETSCAQGWMNFTQTDMAVAFADYIYQDLFVANPGVFDGIHFDHLIPGISWAQAIRWTAGGVDSIDSDRDGIADRADTLDARWALGTMAFCQRIRQLCGETRILIVNGGLPNSSFQYMNGRFHEGFPGPIGGTAPDWYRSMFDPTLGYLVEPALYRTTPQQMIALQGLSFYPVDCDPLRLSTTEAPIDPICIQPSLNATVASALLGDGYACFTGFGSRVGPPAEQGVTYHTTWWFPLYDTLRVNLGQPLGAAYDSVTANPAVKYYQRQFSGGYVRVSHTTSLATATGSFELKPKAIFRVPPVTLAWSIGGPLTIRFKGWDPFTGSNFCKVRLLLSRNGGVSFPETLAVKPATDSLATITVTGPASSNCRLRVETRDYKGLKGWRDSGPFEIKQILGEETGIPVTEPIIEAGSGAGPLAQDRSLAVYPNPAAGGRMSALFRAPSAEEPVALSVFDIAGRLVRTLAAGQFTAGVQATSWDGQDESGRLVAAGSYVLRLTSRSGQIASLRVVVVR